MSSDAFHAEVTTLSDILKGRRARLLFAEALETIPVAVLVADDAGFYVSANQLACRLTGYPRDELLRRSIVDLTASHEADAQERLWNAFGRSTAQQGHFTIKRKDGSFVEVDYHAYADVAPGLHVSFLIAR